MNTLKIEEKVLQPDVKLIKFIGVLDASGQDAVMELEKKITSYAPKTVVLFDCEELTYLNSFAIGYIAHWYHFLKNIGGEIIILKPQPQVVDILSVLGMTRIFQIFDNQEAALASLQNRS